MQHTHIASSWQEAIRIVFADDTDEHSVKIKVPLNGTAYLPPGRSFSEANFPLSLPLGANKVYREDKPGKHFQIRLFDDHWILEYDKHNPRHNAVAHAAFDATAYTAGAAVLVGLLASRN